MLNRKAATVDITVAIRDLLRADNAYGVNRPETPLLRDAANEIERLRAALGRIAYTGPFDAKTMADTARAALADAARGIAEPSRY